MASKNITSILAGYFNTGDGHRTLSEFRDELAALSHEEKFALAQGVCAITGDTIASKESKLP